MKGVCRRPDKQAVIFGVQTYVRCVCLLNIEYAVINTSIWILVSSYSLLNPVSPEN